MFTLKVGVVGSTYTGLEAGSLKIQLDLWLPRLLCLLEAPHLVSNCWQSWAPHAVCGSKPAGSGGPGRGFKMLNPGNSVSVEIWVNQCYYIVWVLFFFSLFSSRFLEPNINCSFSSFCVFLLEAAAAGCWVQSVGDSAANEGQDSTNQSSSPLSFTEYK